jgi:L-ascorbate metabolism protein UlaG (beta-lactamase superfamily)
MKTFGYLLLCYGMVSSAAGAAAFKTDTIPTSAGDVKITFIGHASLIFQFGGHTIHIDPFGQLADYAQLPKADLVLITHDHFDHLDTDALAKIRTDHTAVVLTAACAPKVPGGIVMKNGDVRTVQGIKIEAVPAYNLVHLRDGKNPFHPKGVGNGYILSFGDKRIYVAGDTENTPEMKQLSNIDIAFLPMNLPYTMTPEMVADAALAFKPKVLYPYHFSETDTSRLVRLLADHPQIEVRIRAMK